MPSCQDVEELRSEKDKVKKENSVLKEDLVKQKSASENKMSKPQTLGLVIIMAMFKSLANAVTSSNHK